MAPYGDLQLVNLNYLIMHHRNHPHGRRKEEHGRRNHPGAGKGRRRPHYGPRRPRHNVPVNIEETAEKFIARVFCVGFAKEDVKIHLTDGMLYISGTMPPRETYPDFLLQEYPVKSFERWFELSESVDEAAITAEFEHGVLVIHAPKTSAAKRPEREVKIQ